MSDFRKQDGQFPGQIVVRGKNRLLTIRLHGRWYATKQPDTPAGWEVARKMLAEMYLKAVGGQEIVRNRFIDDAWKEFFHDMKTSRSVQYVTSLEYAYNKIVRSNHLLRPSMIIQDVRQFLRRTDLSVTSANNVVRHFRVFLRWCERQNYLAPVDLRQFVQRHDTGPVRVWTKAEIVQIADWITSPSQKYVRADPEFADLILFMFYTGGRIKETLNLSWDDIFDDAVHFSNKNTRKSEYVPLTSVTKEILQRQFERSLTRGVLRSKAEDSDVKQRLQRRKALKEKVWRWDAASKSRLNRRFAQACTALGIDRNGRSFHALRSGFATALLEKDVPLDVVQELMRHSDPSTTTKYYRKSSDERMRKALAKHADPE